MIISMLGSPLRKVIPASVAAFVTAPVIPLLRLIPFSNLISEKLKFKVSSFLTAMHLSKGVPSFT